MSGSETFLPGGNVNGSVVRIGDTVLNAVGGALRQWHDATVSFPREPGGVWIAHDEVPDVGIAVLTIPMLRKGTGRADHDPSAEDAPPPHDAHSIDEYAEQPPLVPKV